MVIIEGLFHFYVKENKDWIHQNKLFKKWHTHEKQHTILVDQLYIQHIHSIEQVNQ
jgi:hypothetical protein